MDLIEATFPPLWRWAAAALLVPIAAWAAWTAPWRRLADNEQSHVWAGTILCLLLLWQLRASVGFGFTFHLLGVSLFTLLAGPQLALLGTAVVAALFIVVHDGAWANYALATLVAIVPMFVTSGVLRASERWLPPNVFIFFFVVSFLGSGIALAAVGIAASTAVVLGAGQPAGIVFGEYVPYFLYLGFGEATITGMLTTMLVVYRPSWVTTFDDARYLSRR
ncbi:MAG TPA: energy-coupling factor ABC transporter permease [Casimicrobiaceae bacterium]